MVDVAPVTYTELSAVTVVIVISAFANALLYGTFFSLRRAQNQMSQDLSDEINVCFTINRELRLDPELADAIISDVQATFVPKIQQYEREEYLGNISSRFRRLVHRCLID